MFFSCVLLVLCILFTILVLCICIVSVLIAFNLLTQYFISLSNLVLLVLLQTVGLQQMGLTIEVF